MMIKHKAYIFWSMKYVDDNNVLSLGRNETDHFSGVQELLWPIEMNIGLGLIVSHSAVGQAVIDLSWAYV